MSCLLASGNSQKWINLLLSSQYGLRPFATKSHLQARTQKTFENLIKTDKVVIFSKSSCCRSDAAKRLFDDLHTKYTSVELDRREDGPFLQTHLNCVTGSYYMPRIFIVGRCIGGYYELWDLYQNGRLVTLLNQC